MNQSLLSLNKSFSIFEYHLSRIHALLPDISAFYSALASLKFPVPSLPQPTLSQGFASGGSTAGARNIPHDITMNVTLKCDGKNLAKAVIKGKRKIIST